MAALPNDLVDVKPQEQATPDAAGLPDDLKPLNKARFGRRGDGADGSQ